MNQTHLQRSTKRDYWKGHLQQYVESGLSKAAYCRENNLNYDQFKWWYRKFKDEQENKSSTFVELTHKYINTKTEYPVIIEIGGMKVKVNEYVSRDTLKTVIAVLQEAVCR